MKPLLNILLVLTIITCPVRCMTGACCCDQTTNLAIDVESCCCAQTKTRTPDPQPIPELPCKKCQCVCNGAELPNIYEVEMDDFSIQLCVVEPRVQLSSPDYFDIRCRGPDSDQEFSKANSGRTLRCLINSLTL